jgi:chromate reductase, NAD(P)H dehydrogenase (quinone)
LGGLRGLRHLNTILHGLQVFVLPEQKAIPAAHTRFDSDGHADERLAKDLAHLAARLVDVTTRIQRSD